MTELSAHFDIASISLTNTLGYLDFRQPDPAWRSTYLCLASRYYELSQRPSMLETPPSA